MAYSMSFQDGPNGQLVRAVRQRIRSVRDKLGYSWADMGNALDFSNTFVLGISRDDNPLRIRSKHVDKLIQDLQALEVKAGIHKVADGSDPAAPKLSADNLPLEDLVRAIAAKGFSVTISPFKG